MNWDALGAIGEVLGSLGVLVTLVYFAIQLRGSQTATRIMALSSTHEARITVNNHQFENMELIVKANGGAVLSELEQSQLELILSNENMNMTMSYNRTRTLGEDGFNQARVFASFLCDNPSLEKIWHEKSERRRIDFGSRSSTRPLAEWDREVDEHLPDVKSIRAMQ
jgi:hypothetical protein